MADHKRMGSWSLLRFNVRVNPIVWNLCFAGLMLAILGLTLELLNEQSALSFFLIMMGVLILFAGLIILYCALWRDFNKPGLKIGIGALKGLVDGAGELVHDESVKKGMQDEENKKRDGM